MIFRIRLMGLVLAVLVQHLLWYVLYSKYFFSHPEFRIYPEKRNAEYAPQGYLSYLSIIATALQAWVLGRMVHLVAAYAWQAAMLGAACSLLALPLYARKYRLFRMPIRLIGEDFVFDCLSTIAMSVVLFFFA